MGEVEDLVVKGEEGKKGFFCPALIPNKKYNSLRCRFVSDFFPGCSCDLTWLFYAGWGNPSPVIITLIIISPGELKGSISPGASSLVCRAGKSWDRNELSLNSTFKKKRRKKEKKQFIYGVFVHSIITIHGYGNRMTAQWMHLGWRISRRHRAMRSRTVCYLQTKHNNITTFRLTNRGRHGEDRFWSPEYTT